MIHNLAIAILRQEAALRSRQSAELQNAGGATDYERNNNLRRARVADLAAGEIRRTVQFLESADRPVAAPAKGVENAEPQP